MKQLINTLVLAVVGSAAIGWIMFTCWFIMEYVIKFKPLGFQELKSYIY